VIGAGIHPSYALRDLAGRRWGPRIQRL